MKSKVRHESFGRRSLRRVTAGVLVHACLVLAVALPFAAQAEPPTSRPAAGRPFKDILTRLETLTGALAKTSARLSGLEQQLDDVKKLLPPDFDLSNALRKCVVVVDGEIEGLPGPHVIFRRCNVHVQSGMTVTDGPVNGLGNLIIGYNERTPAFDDQNPDGLRRGSHNLVIGPGHSYESFGGLIAGESNTITAQHASVVGGSHNTATGRWSSVGGGSGIRTSDDLATKSNEIGIVSAGGSGFVDLAAGVDTIVETVTLRAPTTGHLAITGSGEYRVIPVSRPDGPILHLWERGELTCSITDGTVVEGSGPTPHWFNVTRSAESGFAATRTFPVSAGDNSFRLVCRGWDSPGHVNLHRLLHVELNAIFVPSRS